MSGVQRQSARAAGGGGAAALAGSIVQTVSGYYTTNADLSTVIPADDTIPTSSEGTQIISVSITPQSTTNKLRARFTSWINLAQSDDAVVAIFGGSTCIGVAEVKSGSTIGSAQRLTLAVEGEYTPGSLTAQTISLRAGPAVGGTIRFNGTAGGRLFGGASAAALVVEEIKA